MTSPWFICGKDIEDDVTSVSCNLVFCSLFCCCCWRLSCFFCKWYKDKRSCPSKKDVLSDKELQLFSSSIMFSIFQPILIVGFNITCTWEVHYEITMYYIGLQIRNISATAEKNHTQFHYHFCKCQEYLMYLICCVQEKILKVMQSSVHV